VQEGRYAFSVEREAPFLVGKIVSETVGDGGELGVTFTGFVRPMTTHVTTPRS